MKQTQQYEHNRQSPIRFVALGTLAVTLGLAGCAVQNPMPSEVTQPLIQQNWSHSSLPLGDVSSIKNFWARWNDPLLIRLINRAVDVNTDVQTAIANLRSARASLISANAKLWPFASGTVSGDTNRSNRKTSDSYSAGAEASWTLNLAGSESWAQAAARQSAVAAALTLADTKELVSAEVAQAYINLRAAQLQLSLLKESIGNYQEMANMAAWQYEAGTSSAAEAEDAKTQLSNVLARLPEIEQSIQGYKNALSRLTLWPQDRLALEDNVTLPQPPQGIAVALPADTIRQRPDVKCAEHKLAAAALSVREAKSNFFPTLSISGNIGTKAATIGALGVGGTGIASLVSALSLPILNWGNLRASQETSEAALDQAKAEYVAVLGKALEETDNALTGIGAAERRSVYLKDAVASSQRAQRLSRFEYETGSGDYTMFLNVQRTLLATKETALANAANCANQYVMLYRALGGSWVADAANLNPQEKTESDHD